MLSEFVEYLRVERGAAENTVLSYSSDLRRLFAFLNERGQTPFSAGRDDLRAFLSSLHNEGLSGSSIARRFATVRSFYRFLRYAGKISANPANGIRVPKLHRRLVENIPDVEVSKLIEHLEAQRESPIALRDCAMIYTLYDSGLRVSEMISLRLVDLNFSCAALRVIGKGDKQRLAPLSPPQILALKAYLERSRPALIGDRPEHGVVFVNARSRHWFYGGLPLTRQTPFDIVQRLGLAVLGRKIHPHQLRHSFGSTLIEHGADPRHVMALMGHADIETTMRYCHVDLRTLKEIHFRTHPRG
jgi:integrase/recombinase XerD